MRINALFWIVLLIPFFIMWRKFPAPTKIGKGLRLFIFLFITIALLNPEIQRINSDTNIIVVADRSASLNNQAKQQQLITISQLDKSRPLKSNLAIIGFENNSKIEKSFKDNNSFVNFQYKLEGDGSNLYDAISQAIAITPKDGNNKIIVLSDGLWTGRNPNELIPQLLSNKISVDYIHYESSLEKDLKIVNFTGPSNCDINEQFYLNSWIYSPKDMEVNYVLKKQNHVIKSGKKSLKAGNNNLNFIESLSKAATTEYELEIFSDDQYVTTKDLVDNNKAKIFIGAKSKLPLLLISPSGKSSFAELLRKSGMNIYEFSQNNVPNLSLSLLNQYAGLILENVPARSIGLYNMYNIKSWVKETGRGLLTTGGKQMYALGGYIGTPLEELLPISMEVKREHRKMDVGISIVLDCSGSMAMITESGVPKISLAANAAAKVLELISDNDNIAIALTNTSYIPIIPSSSKAEAMKSITKVLSVESNGGGINVYTALVDSIKEVTKMPQHNRFVILFADASDANEEKEYKTLVKNAYDAGIVFSVVGLGTPFDCDADFLKDIAKIGGGSCVFSSIPEELPSLFAEEVMTLTKSAFIEDITPFSINQNWTMISSNGISQPPPLGGYNIGYLKPKASMAANTNDDDKSPIVAFWHIGGGRVLSYLGEADGAYGKNISLWQSCGDFLTSMASWVNIDNTLPNNIMAKSHIEKNNIIVDMFLDIENIDKKIQTQIPKISFLVEQPNSQPKLIQSNFSWESIDHLRCKMEINTKQTVIPIIEISGQRYSLSPNCLPYSAEFMVDNTNKGKQSLEFISQQTRGKQVFNLNQQWNLANDNKYWFPIGWIFTIATIVLFIIEIFHRRTNMLNKIKLNSLNTNKFKMPKLDISFSNFFNTNKKIKKKKKEITPTEKEVKEPQVFEATKESQNEMLSAFKNMNKRNRK